MSPPEFIRNGDTGRAPSGRRPSRPQGWRAASTAVIPFFALFYHLLRLVLCAAFVYAGAQKLRDPRAFAVIIEAFGLVPDTMLLPIAIGLPALEIVAAIGLLCEQKGGLALVTLLLLLFIAILGYGIAMGLAVDCGCFGPEEPEARGFASLYPSLYRDLAMLAGCLFLFGWRRFRERDYGMAPVAKNDRSGNSSTQSRSDR